jgi:hypothetical protein
MVAAAAFVVGMHGADPVDPCPIPAARLNRGAVAPVAALVGLRELHWARVRPVAAARTRGHGVAFLVMAGPGSLRLASAALGLGGLFAPALLGAGLAASMGFLVRGLVATALAAWSRGRRGCNSQRRCAGSEHPFHHGISPSQPFKRPKRERVPLFIWRSALSGG